MRADPPAQPLTAEPLAHLDEQHRPHLLHDHLHAVGERAREFAAHFGAGEWGLLAGRWHDLGKYSRHFQRMIREENGFEAHLEDDEEPGPRNHSTAGALHAREVLGQGPGSPLAFVIAGHHAGLSNRSRLEDRLKKKRDLLQDVRRARPPQELLHATAPPLPGFLSRSPSSRKDQESGARSQSLPADAGGVD